MTDSHKKILRERFLKGNGIFAWKPVVCGEYLYNGKFEVPSNSEWAYVQDLFLLAMESLND